MRHIRETHDKNFGRWFIVFTTLLLMLCMGVTVFADPIDPKKSGTYTATLVSDVTEHTNNILDYLGHSWIVLRNNKSSDLDLGGYTLCAGEACCLGLRAGSPWVENYSGAYINAEMANPDVYKDYQYITVTASAAKLKAIFQLYRINSYYTLLEHNCTTVAVTAWDLYAGLSAYMPWNLMRDELPDLPLALKKMMALNPNSRHGTSLTGDGIIDSKCSYEDVFYLRRDGELIPVAIKDKITGNISIDSGDITDKTAFVRWSSQKVTDKHVKKSFANGYQVKYWKVGDENNVVTKNLSGFGVSGVKLTGLEPDTDYTVTVYASYKYKELLKTLYRPGMNGKQEFFHTEAEPSIMITQNTTEVKKGKSIQLTAVVTGHSKNVSWRSSKPKIASVDSKGKVTGLSAGTATITASANGLNATCMVTVYTTGSFKLVFNTLQMYVGGINNSMKVQYIGYPRPKLTYKSDKPSVVKVDEKNGILTAKKAGTATITVSSGKRKLAFKVIVKNTSRMKSAYLNILTKNTISIRGKSYPMEGSYFNLFSVLRGTTPFLVVRLRQGLADNTLNTVLYSWENGKLKKIKELCTDSASVMVSTRSFMLRNNTINTNGKTTDYYFKYVNGKTTYLCKTVKQGIQINATKYYYDAKGEKMSNSAIQSIYGVYVATNAEGFHDYYNSDKNRTYLFSKY